METLIELLLYTQGPVPYIIALVILLLCGLGLPIPEDITLFIMGLLSYYGLVNLYGSILICLLGVLAGDIMIYAIGHHYGLRFARRGFFSKVFSKDRMDQAEKLFHKYGNKVILAARFMPGLRAPTYFSAGALKLPFKVFLFYDGLAALLSVPLLVCVTYLFGDHFDKVVQYARKVQHGIVFLIVAAVVLFVIKEVILHRKKRA